MSGVRPSTKAVVVAVASRSAEKAQRFAAEYKIPRALANYEALLADDGIDAIYIPVPNSLHAEWTLRAIDAGKHVLCEKPLAASADVRAMFHAARRRGVHLVEAYPYLAQPQTLKLRELLRERAIGEIKLIHAAFGFTVGDLSRIRLDPTLGGGALLDAGCYPVSLIRMIAGERPLRVHAVARWGDTNVERTLVATLEFKSGLLAQISCSFETSMFRRALISGDAGILETGFFNNTARERPPTLQIKRGAGWSSLSETLTLPEANGFLAETDAFADLVAGHAAAWPGPHETESLDIALTLEAIAQSARTGAPVTIGAPPP